MILSDHIKIGEGGRVVIPAAIRTALGLKIGDRLIIRADDSGLHMHSHHQAFKRLREKAKKRLAKTGISMTDDFLAFRKKDSGD